MKIRMRTIYASPHGVCDAGQTIELPDAEAYSLVKAGNADPVNPKASAAKTDDAPETAMAAGPKETAAKPKAGAKG